MVPRLAGRAREHRAPAEQHRQQDQHGGAAGRDAERCPEHEVAPVVLEQIEPVERLRQVGELLIGGEIWRVVGQRPGVEDILLAIFVPAAGHQIVPGEPAHRGRRHGSRRGDRRRGVGRPSRRSCRRRVGRAGSGRRRRRALPAASAVAAGRIGGAGGGAERSVRARIGIAEDRVVVLRQDAMRVWVVVERIAGRVDLVPRHRAGVGFELLHLVGGEAAALEQDRRGREIARAREDRLAAPGGSKALAASATVA